MAGPSRSSQVSVLPAVFIIGIVGFVAFFCGSCAGVVSTSHLPPQPPALATLELVPVASGFSSPLDVRQPDDNSGRLFVVEQGGHIQIIQSDGTRAAAPFLDVTARTGFTSGGETGLLGLAFHPNYQSNRHFYVNYTRNNGTLLQTVIAEFTVSAPRHGKHPFHRGPANLHSQRRLACLWQGWPSLYRSRRRWRRERSIRQRAKHQYAPRKNVAH